jgi:hypothetical protein
VAQSSGDHTPPGASHEAAAKLSQMANYRIVSVDDAGNVRSHRNFACATDEDAIVWAKQLESEKPTEVWSGPRFVARVEPRTRSTT